MRRLSRERGLEIIELGRKAFMAMFEICPFKDEVEHKLWTKGYNEAKAKWFKKFENKDKGTAGARRNYGKKVNNR
jgi:hypothetical protein